MAFAAVHFYSKNSQSEDYEDYLKAQKESFQSYKDSRDAEFIGFLKEQWREYNVSKGLVRDDKPKPSATPVAAPHPKTSALPKKMKIVKSVVVPQIKPDAIKEKPVEKPEVPLEEKIATKPPITVKPLEKPVEKPVEKPLAQPFDTPVDKPLPRVDKPVAPPVEKQWASPLEKPVKTPADKPAVAQWGKTDKKPSMKIDFYSTPILIYGKYDFPNGGRAVNKEMITSFWDKMSQIDYGSFIDQVRKYKTDLKLNDWGYHYVLYRLGMKQYNGDKNMSNLFVWYMSSKSGYESRIGYNDTQIFLLMPSKNRLYSIPFLTLKNKKYYSLFFDDQPSKFKTLFTYQGNYPEAEKTMDFGINTPPQIPKIMKQRNLKFDVNKKNINVEADYNKNIVDFFKYYPQTNIKVYFDAFMSPELEYALIKSLKPLVEGKTEAEAVNNLLRFVQKSFDYKTDDGQFGHEKYMLPDETVFYPYSDCEDRSFFFAYLVKKLVRLDVVGLDYPGHVATGVKFSDNLPGDYVINNSKKYMVCDPTYVNATLGMAMPQFKSVRPEIVFIGSRG